MVGGYAPLSERTFAAVGICSLARQDERAVKPAKSETKQTTAGKSGNDDSGLGADLKNPFGKKK